MVRSDHPGTTLCSSYTVTRSMWSRGKASSDPCRCLWASITADWKWPAVVVGTPHVQLRIEGHFSKRQYPCPSMRSPWRTQVSTSGGSKLLFAVCAKVGLSFQASKPPFLPEAWGGGRGAWRAGRRRGGGEQSRPGSLGMDILVCPLSHKKLLHRGTCSGSEVRMQES